MNIRSVALVLLLVSGCQPDLADDPIPLTSFVDEVINLTLVPSLQLDRGTYLINNKGVRGIIVYRQNATTFRAFERNCSFQPNNACATVEVHNTGLFMLDPCCSSQFDFQGEPLAGPAFRPLRQYRTFLNGSILTVTDEVVVF